MEPAVELEGARLGYGPGTFELCVPHLRVAVGERAALIGPSGCGKSTLLHAVAGVVAPAAGAVRVLGQDQGTAGGAARRRLRLERIGLVFQRLELIEYLTVLDNLLLPLRLASGRAPGPAHVERARTLSQRLGLTPLLDARPQRLSGGERQRTALARALVPAPELVLADEPTGSLDPDNAERALQLLLDDSAERGSTLLVVTHDPGQLGAFDVVHDLGQPSGESVA